MLKQQEIEKKVLAFWKRRKIFDKLKRKNRGKKKWSFIDGPITANNPMGVHHAWGRTYKDLFQRFKAMQGFDQRWQNGFDCQGLWVEVEVEKDLGFNSKRDIENFGLDRFSKACRERVNKFSAIQTKQSIRLGQWMDWKNSYYTFTDENIEYIWYFLRKCYEKGWLYKKTMVLPWCCRCGTSLSQHELTGTDSYRELTHPGVFIKCKIKGKENEYLLIWTTTPWTLTSNVAAAVHPTLTYVKVRQGSDIYYLSKGAVAYLGLKYSILREILGKKLVGLEYESPYANLSAQHGVKHRVVEWKDVSEEEGTGIVHIAPGCGAEDNELGKAKGLAEIAPLDDAGNFISGFGWLTGKNVKGIDRLIINDLKKRGFLYKVEDYKHRYPVCWRCGEELVFRLVREWFISCGKIRPLMKKQVSKVKWYPKHVGALMQDWLTNMGDWCISRKRYWGLPLMFFECGCGNVEVIGSKKELKKKAINPKEVDRLPELHRPWIDAVKIKCSKCGKTVERIKEVGDCWLDAGIVPFSTLRYFDNRPYWKKWFPAELVIEMREQVRLWFYTLLFMAVTLENKTPYKAVFAYEKVNDEHGKPMHKSLGNVIWFDDAAERMGADVMRWIYTRQNPLFNLNFGYKGAEETKRTLNLLSNISNYIKESVKTRPKKLAKLEIEDKWFLSRLNSLIDGVTRNLESLKPQVANKLLEDFFINTLSREYIQYIRDRIQARGRNKQAALYCLYTASLGLLKMLAPFIPFLTEHIYQDYFKNKEKKESVHLCDWPKSNKKLVNKKLEQSMEVAKQVITLILAKRREAGIGIRWPLASATITMPGKITKLQEIVKRQTNIKELKFKQGKKIAIKLDTKLTPALEAEGYARELVRRIQEERKKAGLRKEDKIELVIQANDETLNMLQKQKQMLEERINAPKLIFATAREKLKKYKSSSVQSIKDKRIIVKFSKKA